MGGHFEVDKLATPMTDEEDDVQGLEGLGLNDEEVGGPDRLSLVGKKVRQLWLGGRDWRRRR